MKTTRKRWTEEDDTILLKMRKAGRSHIECAAILGRTAAACSGRLCVLANLPEAAPEPEPEEATLIDVVAALREELAAMRRTVADLDTLRRDVAKLAEAWS